MELKQGTDSDALSFAQSLAHRFGLTPQPESKLRRALSLAEDAEKEDGK